MAVEESLSYRDAMTELQDIVSKLRETEDIDVDDLVKDVARAKELIEFCNGKVKRADASIKTIVGELQAVEAQSQLDGASAGASKKK